MLGISSVFWGIVTFSILVLLHEGGHFLAAKAFGLRVKEFMLGLPGPKLSFTRGETTYGVTAIPLGGYVRIAGMEGAVNHPKLPEVLSYIVKNGSASFDEVAQRFDLKEDELGHIVLALVDWDSIVENEGILVSQYDSSIDTEPNALMAHATKRTYVSLPTHKRIAILVSGVLVNIVVAIAVFTIVLAGWGSYEDVGHVKPLASAPAAAAGIKAGDDIVSINGLTVDSFAEITKTVRTFQPGDTVKVQFGRSTDTRTADVILGTNPDNGLAYLGVGPQLTHMKLSLTKAFMRSLEYVKMTVEAIIGFFTPSKFQASVKSSTSIVGISVIAAKAVASGPLDYAWLLAAISLSLGLMNLLPIPPLDGGKILFEIIERTFKKPIPLKASIGVSLAGFVVLFSLMAYLMAMDIGRLIR